MAAGCVESAHILLIFEDCELVGPGWLDLSEHMYAALSGHLPQRMGRPVTNEDGNGAHKLNSGPDEELRRGKEFLRG
jgi:hypothetical protein